MFKAYYLFPQVHGLSHLYLNKSLLQIVTVTYKAYAKEKQKIYNGKIDTHLSHTL